MMEKFKFIKNFLLRHNIKFRNKFKFIFCCLILFMCFTFQTIAYSALSTTSRVNGDAFVRVEDEIRITHFSVAEVYSDAISSYEQYSKNTLQTSVILPYSDSYIKYKVMVTNFGNIERVISAINESSSNLSFTIEGYGLNDVLCDDNVDSCTLGSTTTFYIKVFYNSYDSATTEFVLNFDVVFNYAPSPLVSGEEFNQAITNRNITSIVFTDISVPEGVSAISLAENGSPYILGWEENSTFYVSNGRSDLSIYGNQYCSHMFENLPMLESIDFTNFSGLEVVYMNSMFANMATDVSNFTFVNLSNIDGPDISYMSYMFSNSFTNVDNLNIDLSGLGLVLVSDMSYMFYRTGYSAKNVYMNLSGWLTYSLMDISHMFEYCAYETDVLEVYGINSFRTANVTSMNSTFKYFGSSTAIFDIGDLGSWRTDNVTDMSYMFNGTALWSKTYTFIGEGLDRWNTSRVTNMSHMFHEYGMYSTNWYIGDLSTKVTRYDGGGIYTAWDTSNVVDMSYMFADTAYSNDIFMLGNIGNWNTSKVTNMSYMFKSAGHGCSSVDLIDIGTKTAYDELSDSNYIAWDTSSVTNMAHMFDKFAYWNSSSSALGDISNWNTSKVTDMSYMFNYMQFYCDDMFSLNLSGWNAVNVLDMSYMFYNIGTDSFGVLYLPYNIKTTVIKTNVTSRVHYKCDFYGNVLATYAAGEIPTGSSTSQELATYVSAG